MKRTLALAATGLLLGLVGATNAVAGPLTFRFSDPKVEKNTDVTFTIGVGTRPIPVTITPTMHAKEKREEILRVLNANGITAEAVNDGGKPGIKLPNLKKGTKVHFSPGGTAEAEDTQTAMLTPDATFGFDGMFAALDPFGIPSLFTGGLITDLGRLAFTISANDLPSLDGFTITQAFFNLLSPSVSTLGAQILNHGTSLEFLFDPNVTFGGAGVIFGTTSPTEGLFGEVTVGAEVPEPATLVLFGSGLAYAARGIRRHLRLHTA